VTDYTQDGLVVAAEVPRAYDAIRARIIGGEIPPETRINIDALGRELGVSQTPVREALHRLEGDGLLEYVTGRGYRTTAALDRHGLISLFEFRLLVEPWAARIAAADSLANPARELDIELQDFEARISAGGDVREAMLAHDTRFHSLIVAAASNSVLETAYLQTHAHLHVFRLFPVDITGRNTLVEHRAIAEAIGAARGVDAERAAAEHIKWSFERSSTAFGDPLPSQDRTTPLSDKPRMVR
jgi:DNA-binding GntR family transcriptional regulator